MTIQAGRGEPDSSVAGHAKRVVVTGAIRRRVRLSREHARAIGQHGSGPASNSRRCSAWRDLCTLAHPSSAAGGLPPCPRTDGHDPASVPRDRTEFLERGRLPVCRDKRTGSAPARCRRSSTPTRFHLGPSHIERGRVPTQVRACGATGPQHVDQSCRVCVALRERTFGEFSLTVEFDRDPAAAPAAMGARSPRAHWAVVQEKRVGDGLGPIFGLLESGHAGRFLAH